MEPKLYKPGEIEPFGDGLYESRLLLDSRMAGERAINVNHCTIFANSETAGDSGQGLTHAAPEVYLAVSGSARAVLAGRGEYPLEQGSLLYIPAGVPHYIINDSPDVPFVVVTIYADEHDNPTHAARRAAWGEDGYIRIRKADSDDR